MKVEDLLDRLDHFTNKSGGGWKARCPAHEDREPSLSIDVTDDRILLKCFAGCATGNVMAALGLDLADLYLEPRPEPERVPAASNGAAHTTWYEARDLTGQVVARHKRVEQHGKKKRMSWWRPGATEPGLNGEVKLEDLTLFDMRNLDDWPVTESIILVEGEKKTLALTSVGVPALGTMTGASGCPTVEVLRVLAGRRVILWPDNDDAGRKHMERLGARLLEAGVTAIKWFTWVEAPAGGDAANYLASNSVTQLKVDLAQAHRWPVEQTKDDSVFSALLKLEVAAERIEGPPARLGLVWRTAEEIANATPETVDWLAYPWLAAGTITEIDASQKAGKTTLILAMCRAMLDGRFFLGGHTRPAPIIYLTEQPDRTFKEALRRANLLDCPDLHVLRYIHTVGYPWPAVVADAIAQAQACSAGTLVIDTLPQFASMRGDMENSAGAALEAMQPVQLAAEAGLGIIIVRHERKSGGEVGHSARGSSAFGGVVDTIVQLRRPEGNARPTIRVLASLSRFDEVPDTLAVELLDTGDYTVLGDAADVAHSEATAALLAAAPTTGLGLTVIEILKHCVTTHRTIAQQALADLVEGGQLTRTGVGKKGDPYRYARAGEAARQTVIHSAGTPNLSKAEKKNVGAPTCVRCGEPARFTTADGQPLCVTCITLPPAPPDHDADG